MSPVKAPSEQRCYATNAMVSALLFLAPFGALSTTVVHAEEIAPTIYHEESTSNTTFDLQAHRGGRGEHLENSAPAFIAAANSGVTTLELDIVLSSDGVPVVWHDNLISGSKCSDTEPVKPGDPQFPYVGKAVGHLTWEQLQKLNCDKIQMEYPNQEPAPGNKLITFDDVIKIATDYPDIKLNVETKVDPSGLTTPPAQEFVDAILPAAETAGILERTTIQSFDWNSLVLVKSQYPEVRLSALSSPATFFPLSPFNGPVDYLAVGGDPIKAASVLGVDIVSPLYNLPDISNLPGGMRSFVQRAHASGLEVIPYTVDDSSAMADQIDAGVDGIITDYPTRAEEVLTSRAVQW